MSARFSLVPVLVLFLLSGCSKPPAEADASGQSSSASADTAGAEAPAAEIESHETGLADTNAYFGELHLHTSWSLDAFGFGNQVAGPDEAYRFAKGERIEIPGGGEAQLSQPLDFAAVVEHSEWIGETRMVTDPALGRYDHPAAIAGREGDEEFFKLILEAEAALVRPEGFSGKDGAESLKVASSVWQEIIEITERHNDPGTFTTLHGFEWTAAPDGNNLHRNVIFRDADLPSLPTSWFESQTVEELWTWLETTGGGTENVLAIPHNANMSGGLMFRPYYSDGSPIDAEYAARRAANEPLFELVQAKGASESSQTFSPNDEFIGFELVGDVNFVGPVTPSEHSWVREALKDGLALEKKFGVNPFGFGFAAGTDQHNGLMGDTEEYDFKGSHGLGDATVERRLTADMEVFKLTALNPGGLTGVWAPENTREEIWQGLRRKETFATSGVRIRTRMFGGFEFEADDATDASIGPVGYEKGVAMGNTLGDAPADIAPAFLVQALMDPLSGNLDRIQVVKGWMESDGSLHEKIYNVAWSDDRELAEDGSLPAVGNTVNVEAATFENSIGATQLTAYWRDPDFDPDQSAFYYARVLQIPTPRWTTYDAVAAGMDLPEEVPATIQERAWTSPIWYTP